MDRPSVREMERSGFYEIDRQTKCQKMKMQLKWIKFYKLECTEMY